MAKTRKAKRVPGKGRARKMARSSPGARARKAPAKRRSHGGAPARDAVLREQLVAALRGGHAHATYEDVVQDVPAALRGQRPNGAPYSPWMLLEHIRIAMWDILEFSRNPSYVSPAWPDGYWPADPVPPNGHAWDDSVARYHADREAFERLVRDPASDLFTPFAHGSGQTLLREVMVAATHTSYHLGELVVLRRLLGAWPA
ncbi:MAG TPA: DinB family protein [Gemmatimonadaceae bacterium]|nr:DinB family protein [Gemmatimonadaceae bacterium]